MINVTAVATIIILLQIIITIRLQNCHPVVIPVFRPADLPRITFGIILGIVIYMKYAKSALRYCAFDARRLSILNKKVLTAGIPGINPIDLSISFQLAYVIGAGHTDYRRA